MGNTKSEIEDKERIRIYRRVSLLHLRKEGEKIPYIYLNSFPVSRNFGVVVHPNGEITISPCSYERSGSDCGSSGNLWCLIKSPFRDPSSFFAGKKCLESLMVGLNKEQYELIFFYSGSGSSSSSSSLAHQLRIF